MTIKIEIEVPQDFVQNGRGSAYLDRAIDTFGWKRAVRDAVVTGYGVTETDAEGNVVHVTSEAPTAEETDGSDLPKVDPNPAEEPASADIDTRLVGEPADGNKRRNSEQKAEDDEFEALAGRKGITLDQLNGAIKQAGRAEARIQLEAQPDAVADAKPAISTGEERVGPEDDAATQAQDKADEQAEAAARSDGSLTHDDLRRAVGAYQKAHGMAAAVRAVAPDGFIGCTIDKVPTEKLAEMIAKVEAATAEAPAKVEPAKTEEKAVEPEAKPATRDDLLGAMKAYARKYDGTDSDPAKMTATMSDMPKIFQHVFGPGIEKQSQVPDPRLGEAVAAVRAAIDENPFGRDAKNG